MFTWIACTFLPFPVQGSNVSRGVESAQDEALTFNLAHPEGTYSLELEDSAQRAVAVQLCTLDIQSGQQLLRNIVVNGKHIKSCAEGGLPENLPTFVSLG